MKDSHYLKAELYELFKKDDTVFEFLQLGSLDGIWYWDLETQKDEWMSPRFWTVLGYEPSKMKHLASEWQDLIFPEDLEVAIDNFVKHCTDPSHPYDQVVRYHHKNGSIVWVRCRGVAIRDETGKPVRMLGAHTDLTSQKRAELALEKQLKEKELLLREVHHRLKNNITMIRSLLNIQADRTKSDESRESLKEAVNRVESIRLIYDKLLLKNDYRKISTSDYLQELIQAIDNIFPDDPKISIDLEIADVELEAERLFLVGLIVNELVTNSMKYGFEGKSSGHIFIDLSHEEKQFKLVIRDNGVGYPDDFEIGQSTGFGLTLVQMLSEQLEGTFSLGNDNGARCSVQFEL